MAVTGAPEVSVVVPVHGDRGGLGRTLDHLAAQLTDRTFEVLVVDNGDNGDLEPLVASHPRARLLAEQRRGSYAARNTGVAHARGSVLAFTDADCLPEPRWLARGLAALEVAGPGSFVGGAVEVVLEHGGAPSLAELWQLGHDLAQERYVTERGWAVTANLLVRADDLARAGAFDAALESGGDREWGERATATGLRATYAPDAVVRHPARRTLRSLRSKLLRVTRGAVARSRTSGVPVHRHGLRRACVPQLRSSWRVSARVSPRPVARVLFVAVSLWAQYLRLGYERRLTRAESSR